MAGHVEVDSEFKALLNRASEGDVEAWKQAFALMYNDLRKMAHKGFGWALRGKVEQPTSLVHEMYARMQGKTFQIPDRIHFLALCKRVMRNILIDLARRDRTETHGGDVVVIPLPDGGGLEIRARKVDLDFLLEVDRATDELRQRDAALADVFELRYWDGATNEEVAAKLHLAPRDARTYWETAKFQMQELIYLGRASSSQGKSK